MRILLTLTVSLLMGVILQLFLLPGRMGFLIAAGLIMAGFVLFLAARRKWLRGVLILYGAALGLLFAGGYEMLKVEPVLAYDNVETELTAIAVDYSQENVYGTNVEAEITLPNLRFRAVLYLDDDLSLKPGDEISGRFYLRDSLASGNYSYYSDGIFLQAYQQEELSINYAENVPLQYLPKRMAHRIEEVLLSCFPEDVWGYGVALTTGNRNYLSDGEVYDLKISGCYHALALSGMHLTILAALAIVKQKNKWIKVFVALPVCGLFTVMTGLTPSMVRSLVMLVFVYFAPLFHRESDGLTNLSLAGLILMLQNPWSIASWGLQLSFGATLGIVLFDSRIFGWLKEKTGITKAQGIRCSILSGLSTTLSAQFFTVPLQMTYFGYMSIVAPITNLLTSGLIELCFACCLITGIVALFLQPVGRLLGWAIAWGFRYVKLVMAFFADLPFAAVFSDVPYAVIWVILCYGILFALLFWPKGRKIIPICSIFSALAALLLLTSLDSAGFSFAALDVGQGQCLVARSGGGTVMIDCGGKHSGQIAADYLGSLGESGLDLLMVTHYDSDHIGGIEDLMERKTVEKLLLPDTESEEKFLLCSLAEAYGTEVYFCRADQRIYVGGSTVWAYAPVGAGDSNESGLSFLISSEKLNILVTGDMEAGTELLLLKSKEIPDVDVLVAGHHGSRDSTSATLLSELDPEIVVISVGENNYGHPHDETLERIKAINAEILRTDQRGTIILKEAS